jgi:hypothetical protein
MRMPAEDWDQQLAVLRESLVAVPQLIEGVARLHDVPVPGEWFGPCGRVSPRSMR